MSEHVKITAAGREVVEARRERDDALAEVKRLRAQLEALRRHRETTEGFKYPTQPEDTP